MNGPRSVESTPLCDHHFFAVMLHMRLRGFARMVHCVQGMALGDVGVMCSLFVLTAVVMFGRLLMMTRRMSMML